MTFHHYGQCAVSWCSLSRHGNSQYCSTHARRNREYGHPLGKPITKKELAPYLKRVKQFFHTHRNHDATQEACIILEKWLKDSAKQAVIEPDDRVNRELKRLYDGYVTGMEALTVLGAVWLFAYERPHQLPDDRRTTFALSRALLQTRPQAIRRVNRRGRVERYVYSKPGAQVHDVIGQQVRDSIGIVYIGMTQAFQQARQKELDAKTRLRTPYHEAE